MFKSGYLSSLKNHHHGTTNHISVPPSRVLLVQTPTQSHQRSRPSIHIPLRASASKRTRDPTKHLHGLPPTNGRSYRTNKPMGRAIPKTNHNEPRGLEQLASNRNCGPQQCQKLNHRILPESTAHWPRTRSHSRTGQLGE